MFIEKHYVDIVRIISRIITKGLVIVIPDKYRFMKGGPLALFLARTDRINTYWLVDFTYPDVRYLVNIAKIQSTMIRDNTAYIVTRRQLDDIARYYAKKYNMSVTDVMTRFIPPRILAQQPADVMDIALIIESIISSLYVRMIVGRNYTRYSSTEIQKLMSMLEIYNSIRDAITSTYGYEQFGKAGLAYIRFYDMNSVCYVDFDGKIGVLRLHVPDYVYRVIEKIDGRHAVCYRTYV